MSHVSQLLETCLLLYIMEQRGKVSGKGDIGPSLDPSLVRYKYMSSKINGTSLHDIDSRVRSPLDGHTLRYTCRSRIDRTRRTNVCAVNPSKPNVLKGSIHCSNKTRDSDGDRLVLG